MSYMTSAPKHAVSYTLADGTKGVLVVTTAYPHVAETQAVIMLDAKDEFYYTIDSTKRV